MARKPTLWINEKRRIHRQTGQPPIEQVTPKVRAQIEEMFPAELHQDADLYTCGMALVVLYKPSDTRIGYEMHILDELDRLTIARIRHIISKLIPPDRRMGTIFDFDPVFGASVHLYEAPTK